MSKETEALTPDQIAERERRQARMLRRGVIGIAVLLLAGFAYAVVRDRAEEKAAGNWDKYAKIVNQFEPEDYQWNNPRGVYTQAREQYHRVLTKFLETEASNWDGALEPQVRWRLARSLADHVLSNKDILDAATRLPWYDEAIKQMTIVRDKFQQFPLNWTRLHKDPSTPSLTRRFLRWLEGNREWERKHLPKSKAPDGEHVVVLRTDRGDMHMKLYATDAPRWTQAFLDRAIRGYYDGTSIFMKKDIGTDAPEQHYVRGGADDVRNPKPYDRDGALEFMGLPEGGGQLLEESRNRIVHDRGIVAAWHPRGEEYDHPSEFILLARRSPILDYNYTPIGKLIDDKSLATLDRIFEMPTWNDDLDTVDNATANYQEILDVLQVPTRIVKVLVFKGGTLQQPAGEALPQRVPATAEEQRLGALIPDAYKQDVPSRPAVEKKPDDEAEDAVKDGEEKTDDGDEASGGMRDDTDEKK